MTCREFTEFLESYYAEELTNEERTRFDAHLSVCPTCVTYLETYGATIEASRALGPDARVPDAVPEALVQAILAASRKGAE